MKNEIRTLQAGGSALEIGRALGQAAADAIREQVFATEEFRALASRWRGSDYLQLLAQAARGAYPRFVREIEGLAEGAGQDFETLFLWNCRGDLRLPEDLPPSAREAAASGCTSLLLPDDGCGFAQVAHNEDGAGELLGHCFWVRVEPEEGQAFTSFMYPGMLPGHTFGFNDAGLVQTINNIRAEDLKPGIPRHIITRAVLDAGDLAEAKAILQRSNRASGFHHNLGQAGSRQLVSVEAPASGCHWREAEEPLGHANHLLASTFGALDQEITQSSRIRQSAAERLLAQKTAAQAILFETDTPVFRADDAGDDYARTLATAFFTLHSDRLEWRVHADRAHGQILQGEKQL